MTISPWELVEQCAQIAVTADFIDQHVTDSDDHEAVAVMAVAISEARQQLAEIESKAQKHLIAVLPRTLHEKTGEMRLAKEYVIAGLDGPVTTKRSVKRTQWRNDDLWADVVQNLHIDGEVSALRDALSLGWSVNGLRAIGYEPADYCIEDPGAESVQLPKRKMEERGKVAGEAA